MTLLREITAIVLWMVFLVLGFSCIFGTFSLRNLIIALCCLGAAFLIWPSKRRGERQDDFWLFEAAEFFIEIPIRLAMAVVRLFD